MRGGTVAAALLPLRNLPALPTLPATSSGYEWPLNPTRRNPARTYRKSPAVLAAEREIERLDRLVELAEEREIEALDELVEDRLDALRSRPRPVVPPAFPA